MEDENLAGFLASFDSDVDPFQKGYDGLDSFDHFVENSTVSLHRTFLSVARGRDERLIASFFFGISTRQTSTRTANDCRKEYPERDSYFLSLVKSLRMELRRGGRVGEVVALVKVSRILRLSDGTRTRADLSFFHVQGRSER